MIIIDFSNTCCPFDPDTILVTSCETGAGEILLDCDGNVLVTTIQRTKG